MSESEKPDHTEVVLPDGRFARVRRMKVRDLVACNLTNAFEFQAQLAARLALIDGKEVTIKEVLDGDYETWRPVFKCIMDQLDRTELLKGGIA